MAPMNKSVMQKITPVLWFDKQAGPGPKGSVITVTFELEGQAFMAINVGPHYPFNLYYTFTSAISFVVACKTQKEVDELWEKLSQGGEAIESGWLKDRYGISWQIVPTILGKLLNDPNPVKSQKVMKAMLQMEKLT
jgi:predicted 3-demethylubiquinone-9 3-methyltransferase (glyoxalase superfamily)